MAISEVNKGCQERSITRVGRWECVKMSGRSDLRLHRATDESSPGIVFGWLPVCTAFVSPALDLDFDLYILM